MSDRAFLDSNILVYAHDSGAGERHRIAANLVRQLWQDRTGVLSTQVLQEVWVNLRRKAAHPISREDAVSLLRDYGRWEVVTNTTESVIEAIRLEDRYSLSFWDALIVQAAGSAGVATLFSEDLNSGQSYDGVVVVNPFA